MLNWVLRVLVRLPFDQFYHQYHSVQFCQWNQDVTEQSIALNLESMCIVGHFDWEVKKDVGIHNPSFYKLQRVSKAGIKR